ncbi:MAG: LuxR C-terminal-related transcriptional regulator [Cyanobacteria bacterium J06639_1]
MTVQQREAQRDVAAATLDSAKKDLTDTVLRAPFGGVIAEKLAISKRTVDNHISNILEKTSTNNRVALVRWALQWGKVCIDEVNCCSIEPKSHTPIAG